MALKQDRLLLITSDALGREKELGFILMESFLRTLAEAEDIPGTIFFLNTGVKLPAVREEVLPHLQRLEERGCEILCCGTCLNELGLRDRLRVGKVSSMKVLVGKMMNSQVVTLP